MTKLVIFDCDGVLIDSEGIACAADAEELTAIGYPITTEQVAERFAGVPSDAMYKTIEDDWGHRLPEDFKTRVKDVIIEKYRAELKPIPGAAEVLSTLTLPKCIASSSAPAKLALGLVETELYDLVYPHIFSVALVTKGKPNPDLFLYAAKAFKTEPKDCMVIEDSVAGVKAAKAAGMPCIGFTGGSHCPPGHAAKLTEAGARVVVGDLRQIFDHIPNATT